VDNTSSTGSAPSVRSTTTFRFTRSTRTRTRRLGEQSPQQKQWEQSERDCLTLHQSLLLPSPLTSARRIPSLNTQYSTISRDNYESRRSKKDGSRPQLGTCVCSRCKRCAAFPFAGSNVVDTAICISTVLHSYLPPSLTDIPYESSPTAFGVAWRSYDGVCAAFAPIPTVKPWLGGTCPERGRCWRANASSSTFDCC
jgi:hypothetical protein